jgi:hypothetical protein
MLTVLVDDVPVECGADGGRRHDTAASGSLAQAQPAPAPGSDAVPPPVVPGGATPPPTTGTQATPPQAPRVIRESREPRFQGADLRAVPHVRGISG